MTRRAFIVGLPLMAMLLMSSCARKTMGVGVAFDNQWQVGDETLTQEEQSIVKRTALQTLQDAYAGFDVAVSEGRDPDRLIVVDQHFVRGLGPVGQPAPVGETYPFTLVSRVHFDETVHTLLTVVGCDGIAPCSGKTRAEMLKGLGQGIGATAAHELGHQAGLRFAIDSRCDDCYDSHSSQSYQHFFGTERWSERARETMRRVLPPAVKRQ